MTKRNTDQITVRPITLHEEAVPLLLDELDSDWTCDPGAWPPCWMTAWDYTDDQRTVITDGTYSNTHRVRGAYLSEIIEAFFGEYGGLTGMGRPIAYDPIRQTFLFARNGQPRTIDAQEAIEAFLGLALSHETLTTEQDRNQISDFVSHYGLFIPFSTLEASTTVDTLVNDVVYIETRMAYSQGQTVRIPYHEVADQPITPDARLFKPEVFHGRMLHYYEAFSAWHEASTATMNNILSGNDHLPSVAETIGYLRQSCTTSGQRTERRGKAFSIYSAPSPRLNAEGAAAVVQALTGAYQAAQKNRGMVAGCPEPLRETPRDKHKPAYIRAAGQFDEMDLWFKPPSEGTITLVFHDGRLVPKSCKHEAAYPTENKSSKPIDRTSKQ